MHRCGAGWAAAAAIGRGGAPFFDPAPPESSGEKGVGKVSGKPLHFKGSAFHRVINE